MKISTAHLKRIIKEELFYREFHRGTEELTEDKVSDKISKLKDEGKPQKQAVAIALDMKKRKDLEEASPRKGTYAGAQNLDHLDPEGEDPEEEFFGDKIDPDEVGLQTGEWTPEQFMKFMRRKKR